MCGVHCFQRYLLPELTHSSYLPFDSLLFFQSVAYFICGCLHDGSLLCAHYYMDLLSVFKIHMTVVNKRLTTNI